MIEITKKTKIRLDVKVRKDHFIAMNGVTASIILGISNIGLYPLKQNGVEVISAGENKQYIIPFSAIENRIKRLEKRVERDSATLQSIKEIREGILNNKEIAIENRKGRPLGSTTYSKDQINFLREMARKKMTDTQIIIEFNRRFGSEIPIKSRQLYNYVKRNKLDDSD